MIKSFDDVVQHEYCLGCGLCKNIFGDSVAMRINGKGFIEAIRKGLLDEELFKKICPVIHAEETFSEKVWGSFEECYIGSSTDEEVRHRASSGGVISQLLIYLLESYIVDSVIHVGCESGQPFRNRAYVSSTREEVLRHAGSRYAPVSLLENIDQLIEKGNRHAVVGKPCDIRALKKYLAFAPEKAESIVITLSFFCAGTPSCRATNSMLQAMNVKEEDIEAFRYRGNGWPGLATATTKDGENHTMSYAQSWGRYLGRNILKYCRFCMDGTGERADISCGDAWYLKPDGTPDFSEREGKNVIFARNAKSAKIIADAVKAKRLNIEKFENWNEDLKKMQLYQFERKCTMAAKIAAMHICCKETPEYESVVLKTLAKNISTKRKFEIFLGTINRLLKKKM
jgi:coenzyme F420 hydrogenase subunit beta